MNENKKQILTDEEWRDLWKPILDDEEDIWIKNYLDTGLWKPILDEDDGWFFIT